VVITSSKGKNNMPLKSDHRFLAVMLHAWGSGATLGEAMRNMKRAGGVDRVPASYFVKEFSRACDPYVDQMGMTCWFDESGGIEVKVVRMRQNGGHTYLDERAARRFENIKNG
jgi:hypothetical protein